MNVYKALVRPLAFRLDPERAHHIAMTTCRLAGSFPAGRWTLERLFGFRPDVRLTSTIANVVFPNPVGLGAGYDKDGTGVDALSRMGFGFLEVGSVSRWPSPGNTVRPRAFRLPADDALIINYGVPNDGADVVKERLRRARATVPLGVNVVETNMGVARSDAEVIAELAESVDAFRDAADFLVVSAECANASGAHPLAKLDNLRALLEALAALAPLPPLFIKIRVPFESIDDVLRITDPYPFVRGFRVNTIQPRPYIGLNTPAAETDRMTGSLTSPALGFPVMLRAVGEWHRRSDPARYALIASGGIRSGRDAYAAIRQGASLVQFVTALVFEGPSLARRVNAELATLLAADGFACVADAIGADQRAIRP